MRPSHGFYRVGDQRYLNKLKAVTDAVSMGHWIHWDFHDDVFAQYDWSREPSTPLHELYIQRARKLRDRYDYLALEFSGGSDSWNALYSFVRAGLKVDKIIHKYAKQTVKSRADISAENRWAEGDFQAWPSFQRLRQLDPTLDWFTWDVVDPTIDGWRDDPNIDLFMHNNLHPGAVLKSPALGPHNAAGIPDKPSAALITGIDKPIIELDQGRFYLVFYDYAIIPRGFYERTMQGVSTHDVLFYWDPDCCDLIAKQAHVIMNFLKSDPGFLSLLQSPRGHNRDAYYNVINGLVYPDYRPEWTAEKSSGLIAMEHESWFFDDPSSRHATAWRRTVDGYSDHVRSLLTGTKFQNFMTKDGKSDIDMLVACPSQRYFLGDLNPS